MPAYGDYKKEIKTLGDLREFVNKTLGDLEDDYTFDIDDDFTGVDITLLASCDVSYSEKSFCLQTNSHWYSELMPTVKKQIESKHKARAFDIIKEKNVDIIYLMELFDCIKKGEDTNESALKQYNDSVRNGINKCELTEEEFELLKEVLKWID